MIRVVAAAEAAVSAERPIAVLRQRAAGATAALRQKSMEEVLWAELGAQVGEMVVGAEVGVKVVCLQLGAPAAVVLEVVGEVGARVVLRAWAAGVARWEVALVGAG